MLSSGSPPKTNTPVKIQKTSPFENFDFELERFSPEKSFSRSISSGSNSSLTSRSISGSSSDELEKESWREKESSWEQQFSRRISVKKRSEESKVRSDTDSSDVETRELEEAPSVWNGGQKEIGSRFYLENISIAFSELQTQLCLQMQSQKEKSELNEKSFKNHVASAVGIPILLDPRIRENSLPDEVRSIVDEHLANLQSSIVNAHYFALGNTTAYVERTASKVNDEASNSLNGVFTAPFKKGERLTEEVTILSSKLKLVVDTLLSREFDIRGELRAQFQDIFSTCDDLLARCSHVLNEMRNALTSNQLSLPEVQTLMTFVGLLQAEKKDIAAIQDVAAFFIGRS